MEQILPKGRVLVSGATGLVGTALCKEWSARGVEVVKLVRRSAGTNSSANSCANNEIVWNINTPVESVDTAEFEGFDMVVHLAGEPVFARWNEEKKRRIRESRVLGTQWLSSMLARCKKKPRVFLCASAIGYYGNRGDETLTETSSPGHGFLAEVVRDWEAVADTARDAGIRTVHLRIGVVLSREGGALGQMLPVFRLGLGGRIGDGKHWMSWITLHDLLRAIAFIAVEENITGAVNMVTDQPVTNAEFTAALARTLHRPAIFPVPVFALRMVFGEFADEALTVSERVVPQRLVKSGFVFSQPELQNALKSILG